MGSWGAGAFDNDSAADWAADLGEGGTDAVTLALSDLDLQDVESCEIAVAAAAVVAAARSAELGEALPESAEDWLSNNAPSAADNRAARTAIGTIEKGSALRDLWAGSGGLDEWSSELERISRALRSRGGRSAGARRKRHAPPRLGEVFELDAPQGMIYLQVVRSHDMWGWLVRVIPGYFESRPADLASIIEQPAPRKVFCMVELVLHDPPSGRRLGEFPIPPGEDVYPLFSKGALDPVTGRSRRVAVDVETGETLWGRDTAGLERLSVMMPGYLIAILVR